MELLTFQKKKFKRKRKKVDGGSSPVYQYSAVALLNDLRDALHRPALAWLSSSSYRFCQPKKKKNPLEQGASHCSLLAALCRWAAVCFSLLVALSHLSSTTISTPSRLPSSPPRRKSIPPGAFISQTRLFRLTTHCKYRPTADDARDPRLLLRS